MLFMKTTGYSAYHGRSPLKKALRIFLIFFLLLAVLAVAAFIYLQQYVVISEDGVHLDLPFLQQTPSPSTPVPAPSLDLVTPTPAPTPNLSAFTKPVVLSAEALKDGSALQQVTAGGDCALFDMKTDTSELKYVSAIPLIANTKLNAADSTLNDAIRAMNETEGLYTIARVSCFKDAYVFMYNDNFPIRSNSGYRWTGPDKLMWISPTNPDVQAYVISVCVELAQLGFDEILLDNAGYPSQGNLHYIRKGPAYNSAQFSTVIGSFYSDLAAALAEYDVALSVVTTPEAMAGTDLLTGQTPENLAGFSRLWLADPSGTLKPMDKSSVSQ